MNSLVLSRVCRFRLFPVAIKNNDDGTGKNDYKRLMLLRPDYIHNPLEGLVGAYPVEVQVLSTAQA